MCILLYLLVCTGLRARIVVVEALYKIYYYYYTQNISYPPVAKSGSLAPLRSLSVRFSERERERISTWTSQTVIKRRKKKRLCRFNTSDPFSLLCLLLAVVLLLFLMIFVFNLKQKQLESINCNISDKKQRKPVKKQSNKKSRSTRTMSQFESIKCNSEHTEAEKHKVCFL